MKTNNINMGVTGFDGIPKDIKSEGGYTRVRFPARPIKCTTESDRRVAWLCSIGGMAELDKPLRKGVLDMSTMPNTVMKKNFVIVSYPAPAEQIHLRYLDAPACYSTPLTDIDGRGKISCFHSPLIENPCPAWAQDDSASPGGERIRK